MNLESGNLTIKKKVKLGNADDTAWVTVACDNISWDSDSMCGVYGGLGWVPSPTSPGQSFRLTIHKKPLAA